MASLEADEDDRQEMSEVAEFMSGYVRRGDVVELRLPKVLVVSNETTIWVIVQSMPSYSIGVLVAPTRRHARGDRATHY